MPEAFADLAAVFARLEKHYRDMQDIEFTIENGKLWVLQTRSGKRTAEASLRIAVDLAEEGVISRPEAVMRVDAASLDQLLHPTLDPDAKKDILATGLPASPGAAAGEIVFTADDAEAERTRGRDVILVRPETSPEDIHGMHAAVGILTARGGTTSHAAVVARGMGRPCVSGAGALRIDAKAGTLQVGSRVLHKGDIITIDGSTGQVIVGRAKMREPELSGAFATLMGWADGERRLRVRANADTPRDARQAREFGAEGIGLCRTEHMFFDAERILAVRQMILADDAAGRRAALAKILPMQRGDFEQLFEIMAGLPVTVRLLDPPLHEFLPANADEIPAIAAELGVPPEKLQARVTQLSEFNPMLGFRGCRLGILYPEIPEMQARAAFEAALAVGKKTGQPVQARDHGAARRLPPRVLHPARRHRARCRGGAEGGGAKARLPHRHDDRAAARRVARGRDRRGRHRCAVLLVRHQRSDADDARSQPRRRRADPARAYADQQVFTVDPFVSIDIEGVGELVRYGVERGRSVKPDLKIGICGEHGGDPKSVAFFDTVGLDYVSCSPYRVPIARLAAAQASIRARTGGKACRRLTGTQKPRSSLSSRRGWRGRGP